MEDALDTATNYRAIQKTDVADSIMGQVESHLSTLTKHKSDQASMDFFRVHSPTLRLMDYAAEV